MNKQEALKRIEVIEKEADALRKIIETPEKPKLRHGDWWLTRGDKGDVRIFMKEYNDKKRDCVALRCTLITNIGSEYEGQPILGNVFDLMKEWSEPFEGFCEDYIAKGIRIVGKCIEIYSCTGGSCNKKSNPCQFNIEKAEDFHNALGHAIADLKRKENKSD